MKCIYCVLLLLCPYLSKGQGLKVGDKISYTAISAMYPTVLKVPKALPSKKLTVLDFMGTYCASCIQALPQMEAIQKKYADQMDVLLVSNEDASKLQTWSAKRKMGLPFLKDASALKTLFPFEYISHLVWINGDGKIIAITGKEYFTEANVLLALKGAKVDWPIKKDRPAGFSTRSLLEAGAEPLLVKRIDEGDYQAGFAYQTELPTQFLFNTDSATGISRMRLVNKPILFWYEVALQKRGWPKAQVTVYDSAIDAYHFDAKRFYRAVWYPAFCFSYEATAARMSKDDHAKQLLQFANEFFGTHAEVKDSLVDVWVLKETGDTGCYTMAATKKEVNISSVLSILNDRFGKRPVVDGRIKPNALYVFVPDPLPDDISSLNSWLATYQLQLKEKKMMLPMLVIKRQHETTIFPTTKTYIK